MGNRASWTILQNLRRDESGATLIEFTLIAVLFFLITFSVVEIGLAAWWWTGAEKGHPTRCANGGGAGGTRRMAARITSFQREGDWLQLRGTLCGRRLYRLRDDYLHERELSGPTFDAIVARMQAIFPFMEADNVRIIYEYGGLGFAGGPVIPLITVEICGNPADPCAVDLDNRITFPFIIVHAFVNLISGGGFPDGIAMPPMRATLTGEDLNTAGVP